MPQLMHHLITLYFVGHIEECLCHYVNRYTQNRMRFTLYAMDRELVKDAIQKIESCQFMRALYAKAPSFHVAQRIFDIRRKFARMMRLYVIAHDSLGKSWWEWKLDYYQTMMMDIQKIGMDIDHLVESLTEWEETGAKTLVNIGGFLLPGNLGMESNMGGMLPDISNLPGMPPQGMDLPGVPSGGGRPPKGMPGPGEPSFPDGSGGLHPPPGGAPVPGDSLGPGPGGRKSVGNYNKLRPKSGGVFGPAGEWRPPKGLVGTRGAFGWF